MADGPWNEYRTTPQARGPWEDYAEPQAVKPSSGPSDPRAKLGKYALDTVANIPGSAANLVKGIGSAIAHPYETATTIGKVGMGTLQKMTPDTPSHANRGLIPYADAAGEGLKERYGSPGKIAETLRTDPVGMLADVSTVATGVGGAARGAAALAASKLPRVASAARKVAKTAETVRDATNPLAVPLKAAGAASKAVARPLVKSALQLPGKTERYGATPAKAALEETRGIRPATVKASAAAKLDALNTELEGLAAASGDTADLTAARNVIADAIAKVKSANGFTDDLAPMERQLAEARPGFAGSVTPLGDVAAQQSPKDFLRMKRQFGDDFTKFDAAVPLKDSARKVGNKAYHELSTEFDRAVPKGKDLNQRMRSLIPVKEGAQRAEERAGPVVRSVDRATRPTGGLAATLAGAMYGGIPGAVAAMTVQEALASPTVRMALARALHGGGKGISSPKVRRVAVPAGVAGNAARGSRPDLDPPDPIR